MKALIIINGYYENPNNTYKAKRLTEEFLQRGIVCDIRDAIDLLPYAKGDKISLPLLDDYFFAIDLDKDCYLAKVVSEQIPLFNSYDSMILSDDKMKAILALKNKGVNVPTTIPAPLCYIDNPAKSKVDSFLSAVEKELSYPLVFKECHGSLGKQVKLIKNRQELDDIYKEYMKVPHLYERFLSSHAGHDFRIMIIGSKAVACMERVNKNDFRSNIALGGKGYDVTDTIPAKFKDAALKASAALNLDYAGIDIAIGNDGEPYFLEANGNAFFTEIEKITGINITSLLVDHIISRLKK